MRPTQILNSKKTKCAFALIFHLVSLINNNLILFACPKVIANKCVCSIRLLFIKPVKCENAIYAFAHKLKYDSNVQCSCVPCASSAVDCTLSTVKRNIEFSCSSLQQYSKHISGVHLNRYVNTGVFVSRKFCQTNYEQRHTRERIQPTEQQKRKQKKNKTIFERMTFLFIFPFQLLTMNRQRR